MESTTQPILCCLGATVAGCPTQFLMEKAFGARGLDWRAISVEVPPELFAVAIDGMAAMNFKALRLYPSLYAAAVPAFGEFNPLVRFIGSATSASLTQDGWRAWDHYGFAALKLASEKTNFAQSVCWLHGDSRQTRSVAAALYELHQLNQPLPLHILWTDRPASLPDELSVLELAADTVAALADSEGQPLFTGPSSHGEVTATERAPVHAHDSDSSKSKTPPAPKDSLSRVDQSLSLSDAPSSILLFVEKSDTLRELDYETLRSADCVHVFSPNPISARLAQLPSVSSIAEIDLAIAAEVYDFQRWTEQPADQGLFRDAYEEFCAF